MGYFKTSTVDKRIQIYNVQNIEEDIKVKFLFCFILNNICLLLLHLQKPG